MQEEQAKAALILASDLVTKGWSQGGYALNASGRSVSYTDDAAVRFCVEGAIMRAVRLLKLTGPAAAAPFRKLQEVIGDVPGWNDAPERTHEEVVAALRTAAGLPAQAASAVSVELRAAA